MRVARVTANQCANMFLQTVLHDPNQTETSPAGAIAVRPDYFTPTTIESGPTSGSTRVFENPASFIQPSQSAPV